MGAYRKIAKKGAYVEDYTKAGEAGIKPGHLLQLGTVDGTYVRHATTSGPQNHTFALENELRGKTVDDDYDVSTQVRIGIFQRGSVCAALLSTGETVAIADKLESNGGAVAGELRKYVANTSALTIAQQEIVGQALVASSGAELILVLNW